MFDNKITKYNMKILVTIALFVTLSILCVNGECPPGQFNPGPDCSFEEICPLPSSHTYRRHYCDCWCGPGTVRESLSHKCVKKCPNLTPYPYLSTTENIGD